MSNKRYQKRLNKFLTTAFFVCISNFSLDCLASVDHKNHELDHYLAQISGNQDEKSDVIVDIIKQYKHGTFLDIGSGRDTLPQIIEQLPNDQIEDVKIIAADLEGKTLTEIAEKYPSLLDLEDKSNVKLVLSKMDATEMYKIGSNSVKAINASAVLHEVNSYVPVKTPIDRFFLESIRVLEKNGFLIYRDPTLQSDPDVINRLVLKGDLAKKFTFLFLPKFLDTKLTKLVDMHGNPVKPKFNYQDSLSFKLFLKGDNKPVTLGFFEFFALPTHDIDFTKEINLSAPRRLLSEIERHYVLFVKNVYPIDFLEEGKLQVNKTLHEATNSLSEKVVKSYAESVGVEFDTKLNEAALNKLHGEENKINSLIEKGIELTLAGNNQEGERLRALLKKQNVPLDLYKFSDEKLWLDAKLIPIVYGHFPSLVSLRELPLESMKWLEREGEEFYFYYTTAELIDYLQKFCNYYLKGTDKEGYVLTPASQNDIKYADRSLYKDTLAKDMLQLDTQGNKQEFVTSKTIIRFQLKHNSGKVDSTLVHSEHNKHTNNL